MHVLYTNDMLMLISFSLTFFHQFSSHFKSSLVTLRYTVSITPIQPDELLGIDLKAPFVVDLCHFRQRFYVITSRKSTITWGNPLDGEMRHGVSINKFLNSNSAFDFIQFAG